MQAQFSPKSQLFLPGLSLVTKSTLLENSEFSGGYENLLGRKLRKVANEDILDILCQISHNFF